MKAKLLVFFGIVAVGIAISLFTLTKCHKGDGGDGNLPGSDTVAAVDGKKSDSSMSNPGSDTPDKSAPPVDNPSPVNPTPTVAETNTPAPDATPGSAQPNEAPKMAVAKTPAAVPSNTPGAPGKMAATPTATGTTGKSPESVVGGAANSAMSKDFNKFMAVAGGDSVPQEVQKKLKSVIEDPNLKLDPNRPFWEVAKTRDSVRWMMDFVPSQGNGAAQSVTVDVAKLPDGDYKITNVGFRPTLKDVVAAVENPKQNSAVKVDSLNVAQAFSKAVLTEDFVSARKLCGPKVTDERIAGLMIALEEGKFEMREDRPLIVTFSRDTMSWILSRVNSPEHASEFALELENNETWKVNGLTFGKVIAALAREVDGPYSPIVEDPAGGESLVVYFEFDEAGLTSRADNQLKIVANILRQDEGRKIRITGHADALGSDDYNRQLSSRRAESIREAIIARGANPRQVITEGYGESRPRKPNFKEDGTDNPTGRSENRRAEVFLDF